LILSATLNANTLLFNSPINASKDGQADCKKCALALEDAANGRRVGETSKPDVDWVAIGEAVVDSWK
jgi:hypothetical protein